MAARNLGGKRPGSVRWRADRTKYEARVRLSNGTRPSEYFDRERDAWAWISKKVSDATRGSYINHENRKTGDVLQEWLREVAWKTLRPTQLDSYQRSIGYVMPYIGAISLKDLRRADLERSFSAPERGGSRTPLGRTTINFTMRVVRSDMEYCVDTECLMRNPMSKVRSLKVETSTKRILTVSQIQAILAEAHGTRWYAYFCLLASTALRASEGLGLQWPNVDLETGDIRIEAQTGRIPGEPGVHLLPLKSKAAYRTVVARPEVIDILRWQRDRWWSEQRARAEAEDSTLVFCRPDGRPYYRSEPGAALNQICAKLGLVDISIHTFRHSCATHLQDNGVSLRTVQQVLGHASERMTLSRYSHPTSEGMDRAASVMNQVFEGIEPLQPTMLTAPEGH